MAAEKLTIVSASTIKIDTLSFKENQFTCHFGAHVCGFSLCIVFVQQEYSESSSRQEGNFDSVDVVDKKHGNEM